MSALSATFQRLAKNKAATKLALRYGPKLGATRFVAGVDEASAIKCVQELNSKGMHTMINYLGEYVFTKEAALTATEHCLKTLDFIHEHNLQSNLSVKITSLGLDIDREFCLANLREIISKAKSYNNFVRIEMEDSSHCQATLDVYKQLRSEFDNVGTVLQAYLHRTVQDIEDLNEYKANLRLVKGAYLEPESVAIQSKLKVDENYRKIIEMHLLNGNYTGIASHDPFVINHVKRFANKNNIPREQFEFQFLHGIRGDLQERLVSEGYKVRVYVPYGIDWFGYFMRRLAERPENITFVLKNLFK